MLAVIILTSMITAIIYAFIHLLVSVEIKRRRYLNNRIEHLESSQCQNRKDIWRINQELWGIKANYEKFGSKE